MSIEAMKQALEALEYPGPSWPESRERAAQALRAAIEQAEKQEPVACIIDGDLYYHHEIDWEDLAYQGNGVELLYTTPQPRTWVGLTDEEKSELDAEYGDDTLAHLDAIEAKLKEKNT